MTITSTLRRWVDGDRLGMDGSDKSFHEADKSFHEYDKRVLDRDGPCLPGPKVCG